MDIEKFRWFVHRIKTYTREEGLYRSLKKLYHFTTTSIKIKVDEIHQKLFYQKYWIDKIKKHEIRYVNPQKIEYYSPNPEKLRWRNLGKQKNGSWDQKAVELKELPIYKAIQKRIHKNKEWNDIREIKKAKKGEIKWPVRPSKVEKQCEKIDKLHSQIKQNGYKSKKELESITKEEALQNKKVKQLLDEVCIDIGRKGNYYLVDGRHRTIIAKLLELDNIPVFVSITHKKYQNTV